jgi:glucose-6-phosphate 1-dehydrogenase
MTTANLKKKLIEAIHQEDDKNLLELVNSILGGNSGDKRISKKQYNKELNDAMKRMDQGQFLSQEEVEQLTKKW